MSPLLHTPFTRSSRRPGIFIHESDMEAGGPMDPTTVPEIGGWSIIDAFGGFVVDSARAS